MVWAEYVPVFDEKKIDIDRIEWYVPLTAIGLSKGNHFSRI